MCHSDQLPATRCRSIDNARAAGHSFPYLISLTTSQTMSRATESSSSSSVSSTEDDASSGSYIEKFPRTRHLFDLGSTTSDDIKMNDKEAKAFLKQVTDNGWTMSLEEKIDGANLGFSLSADQTQILVQNRGHYVNTETATQVSIDQVRVRAQQPY